jgi:uncharacterized protein with HEPN domain
MRLLTDVLADARDHARRAADHVEDIQLSDFAVDELRREAVCFCLIVVGEACNEAAKRLQMLPAEIPWAEIKGRRNILIHEYWQIDEAIVYNAARYEARPLAEHLGRLIDTPVESRA